MKKVGILIFAATLVAGLIIANLVSFGRMGASFFKFDINFSGVKGSGHTATDVRPLTDFTSVEAGGIFQVEIVAQKDYSVQVEADDNLLPLIKTEVDDGVLRIDSDGHFKTSSPIRIRISAPNIEMIDASGVSNITLSGVKNTELTVKGSGASKITVAGESTKLVVDVSGATRVNADDLTAETAEIDASGASSVSVNVTNEIRSDLTGASKVFYSGSPKLDTNKSGASSVSKK